MNKTVIKILQGSVVTQTVLGGLTMYLLLQISYSIHRVQKKSVQFSLHEVSKLRPSFVTFDTTYPESTLT